MREQVDRLQKLTTDLLDLSRLDAGSLELELEPVPLRTLANQVAGEFAAAAARKDADDRRRRPRGAEVDVEAICDPERVAQIVRVLVDNALVHTPEGTTVTIAGARPPRARGRRPIAELLVTDDGPGHPQARAGARVRALPHQRLGPGLGARARDRARARAPDARGRSRSPRVRAAPSSPSPCRSRREREQRPRPARPASRCRREAARRALARSPRCARRDGCSAGCGGDGDGDGGSRRPSSARECRSSRGSAARTASTPPRSTSACRPASSRSRRCSESRRLRTILGGEGSAGQGSGFVLDGDGYIATNAHVITDGTGDKRHAGARGLRAVRGRQPGRGRDRRLRPQRGRRAS